MCRFVFSGPIIVRRLWDCRFSKGIYVKLPLHVVFSDIILLNRDGGMEE